MKLLTRLLILSSLVLVPQLASAASDSDWCGLGWQVTQKKSFAATTTRGTTNMVVPPTFGMTSGTIGCARHTIVQKDEAAAIYAFENFQSLRIEMAEGRGENLAAFAETLGCQDSEAFGRLTKANYSVIMKGAFESPWTMFTNLKALNSCGV